ncbi:MAG: hypothetical protein IJA10_01715 [Lachnospiraceae bacterium]|nr:hypothetical protein [Lachnospiraceae bacterium]
MITFQITYDERIPKCTMGINNHPLRSDSKLNDYINTPLERWIDYLLYQLPVETNDRDIHILFSGSDEGYELVRKHVQENLATRKDAQFTVMRKSEYFSHTKENDVAPSKDLYIEEKKEMETLVQGLEDLTFDVLWMRKDKINEIDAPNIAKEPYLSLIDSALIKKEQEDLDAICDEIINYDLEQCDKLKYDITETLYSKAGIELVVAQIEKRKKSILEVEQAKELERLFFGVESFDKDKLNELEAYLRSGKYLSHLIEPYTILVDQRKEILIRAEVELLCESYLTMSFEELEALKQRLLSGEFEEVYVLTYVKLIEVRMDELAIMDIEEICQSIDEDRMEGAENAINRLEESGYKERLWKPYEVALRIQKVYLEKMSLVKKCNDFNQLTQSEAMHLLEWVKEQEINEGTKQAYSQCLTKRIHNIQGLAVYRYSAYLQSLLKSTQVGNLFCLTLISKDYYPKIEELRKTFKEFDDYSMPIGVIEGNKTSGTLIFKDCLMFQEQGLTKIIPLSEVRNIEANKKMLQAQVVLTTHNGKTHPLLTIMGHKKGEEVAKVLLTLVDTIRTKVSLPSADAPEMSLPLWSRSVGEPEKLDHVITIEKVIKRFLLTLNQIDEQKVKYISTYISADWQKKLDKARENFAKYSMEEIPFVLWDASKGNLRYGMCITDRRIYVKTAGGKEYDVSLGQIYEIIPSTTEKGISFLLKLTDTKTQELPFEAMEPELAMKWKAAMEDVLEGILECQTREMIQSLIAQRPAVNLEENFNMASMESLVKAPVEVPVADAVMPQEEIEIPKAEPLIEEEIPVFVPTPDPVFTKVEEPEAIEPEIMESEVEEESVPEPEAEEPEVVEESIPEPEIMEPEVVEESVPEPEIMEPEVVEESVPEPEIMEPEVVGESVPEPEIMEPEVVEESVPEPEIMEPEVVEESVPEPEIMEPEVVEESVPEPEVLESEEEEEVFVEASEESFLDIDALIDRIISGE